MRNFKYITILALLIAGCSTATQLQVTRLGFEPSETTEKVIYALPQTILKIGIQYEKWVEIPGPYGTYAEKFLGIKNSIDKRSESWHITDVHISGISETDPDHYYVINAISGNVPYETFNRLMEGGFITEGSIRVNEDIRLPFYPGNMEQVTLFEDVTIESYVEHKKETMYKTIVTDTSFVQVPVSRTVLEKKTLEKKAEEAANFILELRLSRFELLSGYGEVFPDGEAMEATLKKIDNLEKEYISLFTGKYYKQFYIKEFIVSPEPDEERNAYQLGFFSGTLGFVPSVLEEGDALNVVVDPAGKTRSLRNLMPQSPEEGVYNQIYYRLPDVADISLEWGGTQLHRKRMNIYQLGALVSVPISISKKTPLR